MLPQSLFGSFACLQLLGSIELLFIGAAQLRYWQQETDPRTWWDVDSIRQERSSKAGEVNVLMVLHWTAIFWLNKRKSIFILRPMACSGGGSKNKYLLPRMSYLTERWTPSTIVLPRVAHSSSANMLLFDIPNLVQLPTVLSLYRVECVTCRHCSRAEPSKVGTQVIITAKSKQTQCEIRAQNIGLTNVSGYILRPKCYFIATENSRPLHTTSEIILKTEVKWAAVLCTPLGGFCTIVSPVGPVPSTRQCSLLVYWFALCKRRCSRAPLLDSAHGVFPFFTFQIRELRTT